MIKLDEKKQEEKKTNTLSIVSLVFGIAGLILIPIISPIAALITGIIALSQIGKNKEQGKGIAVAGVVLGGVGIIFIPLIIIGIIAFFGAIAPMTDLPERCTISQGFTCLDQEFSGQEIFLKIQNNIGQDAENVAITITEAEHGWKKILNAGSLGRGQIIEASFPYGYNTERFRGEITIEYDTGTGIRQKAYGMITAYR